MPRRRLVSKLLLNIDPVYSNRLLHQIVNQIMKNGNQSVAYKILYNAMTLIEKITRRKAIKVIERAIINVAPEKEVKTKRIGGAT